VTNPAITALLTAMDAKGVPVEGLDISYAEEFVGFPGGGYTNRFIVVTGGGMTQRFCAELTLKNPFVTATEIARYFPRKKVPGGSN